MNTENAALGEEKRILLEERGHLLLIGLNRPQKLNAFDLPMLEELALALGKLEDDENLRCGIIYANGKAFTAGLDLANVAPAVTGGTFGIPENGIDPWGVHGSRIRTKPLVMAVHGLCLTLGIEMLLAADIRIAAADAVFGQIEIQRGIFPFGGATIRFPEVAGWGNAMRWLLTGDKFDAAEAFRIGLVQEITESGRQLEKAIEIAERIAAQAPLGVQATIVSARQAQIEGFEAAKQDLLPQVQKLMATEDAKEGLNSFIERRAANFQGL